MMTLNKIPFKEVNGAGLFVDTVYEGGSDKNISSEVISKLLHSGVLFISTQYRNSYFNTYNERTDIQRFIDGWLIPRTNKKYCFYAPITENALSELCVDAGLQIKKVFKHDGSCFIIAAKPVDGVQW